MKFEQWERKEVYEDDEFDYWVETYTLAIALRLTPEHIENMTQKQYLAAVKAYNTINKDRN